MHGYAKCYFLFGFEKPLIRPVFMNSKKIAQLYPRSEVICLSINKQKL